MKKNSAIYIPDIEAKDLIAAQANWRKEYTLKKKKDGEVIPVLSKFKKQFDYSLELLKLKELDSDLTFTENDKEYSSKIISVSFKYNLQEWNRYGGKDIYFKCGYDWRDINKEFFAKYKKEYGRGGILSAIKTNDMIEVNEENRETNTDCIYYDDADKCYKIDSGKNKVLMNRAQLREELYKNGFNIDGVHYIRYKRSSGSARNGIVLFIAEDLYKKIHEWEMCGLSIQDGESVDLAALEAYIALSCSSIIDTIQIKPENILLIDDYESVFKDKVVKVENIGGKLKATETEETITNSIFDGESLLDISAFPDSYKGKGMLLLRNRFFKSCCFNCNIQEFFRDNGITSAKQLNGVTRAESIEDIKMITTPSSIKYLKFGTFENWLDNIDTDFGIVKHEKPPRYLHGRMVQGNYQILNSINISKEDMTALVKPMHDYYIQLHQDPDYFKDYIGMRIGTLQDEGKENEHEYQVSDFVYYMLSKNEDFTQTEYYARFRNDTINSLKNTLLQGHLWITGNYSVLLGNGLEMLQHAIGKFNGESVLGVGNVYSNRFDFGKRILCCRSPHVTMGNIYLPFNTYNADIDKYFNMTPEIVYVNAIDENLQQRLNGADYDSDTFLMTDNNILVENALKDYGRYLVPVNCVQAVKTKRKYTNEDKADLDTKTANNMIGQIINTSQYLNSLLWDILNSGAEVPSGLYNDICILAVQSNIEIDKAKKEFDLSVETELKEIQDRWYIRNDDNGLIKPQFFRTITERNGYKLSPNVQLTAFDTAMDYYTAEIKKFRLPRTTKAEKENRLKISDLLPEAKQFYSGGGGKSRQKAIEQAEKAIQIIEEYSDLHKRIYINFSEKSKEERKAAYTQDNFIRVETINKVNSLINPERKNRGEITARLTLIYFIQMLEEREQLTLTKSNIYFDILFSTANKFVYELIPRKNENPCRITVNRDGKTLKKRLKKLENERRARTQRNAV